MNNRMRWIIVLAAMCLVFLASEAGAMPTLLTPNEDVVSSINYQGRLTSSNGTALDGSYPMRFQVYNAPESGTLLWDSGVVNVDVTHGLFNVALSVNPDNFNGQGLWLRIYVDGEWLSPMQALLPVPYALSLRPGAEINGTQDGDWILKVKNNTTTTTGGGLIVESIDGPGIYGMSDNAIGVYGETGGVSTDDYGVYGTGAGVAYGVHGYNSATATGGLGVFGKNAGGGSGVSGLNEGNGNGTWGYSDGYNGVGGATNRADDNYGLYTNDNLYSLNYNLLGAIMQVVQNGGEESLEMGDVVVIAGIGASPSEGLPPLIQVKKARQANSTAVLGVVSASYSKEWFTNPPMDPTGASSMDEMIPLSNSNPVAPGDYLLVVVQGPCQVKASTIGGMIQAGDLLSASASNGYAAKAQSLLIDGVEMTLPGSIFGKALEPFDAGQGMIYVYVTLR